MTGGKELRAANVIKQSWTTLKNHFAEGEFTIGERYFKMYR
jgi:hypothetical protein